MTEFFLQYLGHFHYVGLFILLLLCGVGLPLPEDLVVVSGGYFVYLGHIELLPTILILYAGAVAGDISLYWIGRRFGSEIIAHKRLTWFFTPKRVHAINHYFHKYGNLTLFFGRYLVGLRATVFLSTGAFKIPFRKMLLYDGAAALISIPLLTYLSFYFGDELDQLLLWMRRIEHVLLVVSISAALFFVLWLRRHFRASKEEEGEKIDLTSPPPPTGEGE